MQVLIISFILVMLGVSSIQDFKERLITVWIFPALIVLFICYRFSSGKKLSEILMYSAINTCFILVQFGTIFCYYSLKEKKAVNIFSEKIGMGDLLFFIAITPLFHPVNFIFFLTLALFIILVIIAIFGRTKLHTIPLAGAMGIFIGLGVLVEQICPFSFYTPDWLTNFLTAYTYGS
jgi:hypothetical protein